MNKLPLWIQNRFEYLCSEDGYKNEVDRMFNRAKPLLEKLYPGINTDNFNQLLEENPQITDQLIKLSDTGRNVDYYDLILTGDLGVYGKKILKEYMKSEYNIDLKNYDDSGVMLYDLSSHPVYAGASGPVCLPLVSYSYVLKQMNDKKLKKVLLVATGALHSQTTVNQKLSIPSIAHAISLEGVR